MLDLDMRRGHHILCRDQDRHQQERREQRCERDEPVPHDTRP
jgi:hypothetical protein